MSKNDETTKDAFQFHLVRLKVVRTPQRLEQFYLFQFHLVRLKALSSQQNKSIRIFQFHLVRLKARSCRTART